MTSDLRLARLASCQHGVFTLSQARSVGFTDSMIRWRLQTGIWIRLAQSVYAVASAPATWERQLTAAFLSRPRAIVSGRSAAHLWGMEGIRPGRPEITVPRGANGRSSLARVSRTIWFDELGTARAQGFQVTSVAETIFKLSERLRADKVESVLDGLLVTRKVAVDDFEMIRRRVALARLDGAARFFALLDDRSDAAWEPPVNELEKCLDLLTTDPQVPPSVRQHPFRQTDRPMIVDRYVPSWHLILEADGRRWHTRRGDFERDRARDNAATAAGEAVLRFTWRMLTTDFASCRQTLVAAGGKRAAIAH